MESDGRSQSRRHLKTPDRSRPQQDGVSRQVEDTSSRHDARDRVRSRSPRRRGESQRSLSRAYRERSQASPGIRTREQSLLRELARRQPEGNLLHRDVRDRERSRSPYQMDARRMDARRSRSRDQRQRSLTAVDLLERERNLIRIQERLRYEEKLRHRGDHDRVQRRSQHQSDPRRSRSYDYRNLDQASADLRERELNFIRDKERLELEDDKLRRERSRLRDVLNRYENNKRRAQLGRIEDGAKRGHSGEYLRPSHCLKRSRSPVFSTKEVMDLLNSAKTQPAMDGVTHSHNVSHKNILPDFDPSKKGHRIDVWLKKVSECATVYGWEEKTTIHFALQKLQGLAKTWYESLETILFTWPQWQLKLTNAFPFEQNYGQSLEDMLRRKSKFHEPIEVYYFEKLALLNQCDIFGKRAVECIIHGLTDKTMRTSALSLRCSEPEQLLKFLMSSKDSTDTERFNVRSRPGNTIGSVNNAGSVKKSNKTTANESFCYNCKEKGHLYSSCTKPLIKCTRCFKVGHKVENCFTKPNERENKSVQKTLTIVATNPNSKFYKEVKINGTTVNAFVDFGSEVSLLRDSQSKKLGLQHDDVTTPLKGFGNGVVLTKGRVVVELDLDGVSAQVTCHVVDDKLLDVPLFVGQSYTEQPHVHVYKNAGVLQFIDGGDNVMPFTQSEIDNDNSIKIISATEANLCGPAVIRAYTEPQTNGHILLESKLIGQPTQQFVVCGGVYETKNGHIDLYITPSAPNIHIYKGAVIGRATKVNVVNRLTKVSDDNEIRTETRNQKNIAEEDITIGENVNDEQKVKLLELLNSYKHCFASNLKQLGCTNAATMNIEINNTRPIVYRPYRLSYKERDQVRDMVGEMLEAGIIRESSSEYASPIILVRKKNGQMRICIDYRLLNSVTVKERFPMPVIEDEIAKLSDQAYFSTLDLASGYYQVPISEQAKALTAFVTPDGQYEFNRMPFGLANAPAIFQRMMNKILGSARYSEATVYIDDVLVYGKSVDECLERLKHILQLLEAANLTLNLAKCEFLKEKIDYLGYEVSASGIRPGDKKVQSVLDFPRPTNVHTVRQFLGLVGYFRKFILNFAQIAHPLSKLLKKDVNWIWEEEQEKSFATLKNKLVNRPVLAIYNPNSETELHTDASKYGVGGILLQRKTKNDTFRPVAYYSRQTSPEERNFHAYELETLAVVCSLRKFRVYLLGQNFKIVTDCSALRSTFSKRDIIPRIARWWLLVQEFPCTIEYRPGLKMAHVDALSRNAVVEKIDDPIQTSDVDGHYPTVMAITGDDWLHTLQLGDGELGRIRDIVSSDLDVEGLKQIKDNYMIKENKLYRCINGDKTDLRWAVPKGARWQLLRMNHDDIGHFGVEKTLERIKKAYWFPNMTRFVKKYVEACIECAYSKKTPVKEGLLHPITKVESPFHTVHIDHLGPFVRSKRGNSYLLVIVDAFTKFVFIRPVRNTKSIVAIKTLEDIFYTFRVPDRVISDRGTCFTSHAFRKFCLDKGIKHVLNAVASPRSNGQVERYNRTILASLTAQNLNDDERNWDDKVGKLQWGLNNTTQKTTGRSPAEVMFGTSMNSEIDPRMNEIRYNNQKESVTEIREEVKDRIDEEQTKQKQQYDKGKNPSRVYSEGELVKIKITSFKNDGKSKKLLPQYSGPYRVISVLGNDRYKVAAIPGISSTKNKRKTVVSADRMLPWVHIAALNVCDNNSDHESCNENEDDAINE